MEGLFRGPSGAPQASSIPDNQPNVSWCCTLTSAVRMKARACATESSQTILTSLEIGTLSWGVCSTMSHFFSSQLVTRSLKLGYVPRSPTWVFRFGFSVPESIVSCNSRVKPPEDQVGSQSQDLCCCYRMNVNKQIVADTY